MIATSNRKQVNRNFVIFHPSDFSAASEVAFAHALKIALQSKAKFDICGDTSWPEKPYDKEPQQNCDRILGSEGFFRLSRWFNCPWNQLALLGF
jgi:hypothetical protein